MARPPYQFFTPLNKRRHELIKMKHAFNLSEQEERELKMLTRIVDAMIDFRYPMREGSLEELEALIEKCEGSKP